MDSSRQQRALLRADCTVAFDHLTRQLYATDASIYEVMPLAVAFPKNATQAASIVQASIEANIPITPRGAGSGLVGGALGDGLIIDFARHNRDISEFDPEQQTIRVGPGVVLDQLNAFLKQHGLCFGPDVATSSRATLGGMIANNSSGARVPVYGTTSDHVVSLDILTADGQVHRIGREEGGLADTQRVTATLASEHASEIGRRMPPGLLKRWPGFGLDRFLREPKNLAHLLAGSEGTLAAIVSAKLAVVPLPRDKGLGILFFRSVPDAMHATVELLRLKPAAIEHIDRVLLDQTRGQRQFQAARDLLGLDAEPCESLLMVEFYGDVAERLRALEKAKLGRRTLSLHEPSQMNLIWALRKAGLSLLTGRAGSAKPVTCIEDTAVRPEQLPGYVQGLEAIMKPLGIEVCYYGHAAAGLLHVRPVLDLHRPEDLKKLRFISDEVSSLVQQFKGSLSAEHGVGMARTEYMRAHLGSELVGVMRAIKTAFDPQHLFNPGKIIDAGVFKIDAHLRFTPGDSIELPFQPRLAFAAKDHSFIGNLEQCNGCGGCRKDIPTMCPTFAATGDEIMSTRGRANILRAVLTRRSPGNRNPLLDEELEIALSNCLGCKACTTECPSNVNMTLLKAEVLHARQQRTGVPWRERLLSHVDLLARFGCLLPSVANAALRSPPLRWVLERALGIASKRPLPRYTQEPFDRWFRRRQAPTSSGRRGRVILWDDTFVRYYEPQIGKAAVTVLEAAGFEVSLPPQRQCCGRPAFSQGHLDRAARLGRHNLALLGQEPNEKMNRASTPIIFLEPSCYSMFVQDYRELGLANAEQIAQRSVLFEDFMGDLLAREPGALHFRNPGGPVAIHAHCHAKALTNPATSVQLAQQLPGATAKLLNTSCCGMAGAFGALASKLELSLKIAEPLARQVTEQPPGTIIVASGTSCRQQIGHITPAHPVHMAELLSSALQQ